MTPSIIYVWLKPEEAQVAYQGAYRTVSYRRRHPTIAVDIPKVRITISRSYNDHPVPDIPTSTTIASGAIPVIIIPGDSIPLYRAIEGKTVVAGPILFHCAKVPSLRYCVSLHIFLSHRIIRPFIIPPRVDTIHRLSAVILFKQPRW